MPFGESKLLSDVQIIFSPNPPQVPALEYKEQLPLLKMKRNI